MRSPNQGLDCSFCLWIAGHGLAEKECFCSRTPVWMTWMMVPPAQRSSHTTLHITSHLITSHHITAHHIASHHITSHHITHHTGRIGSQLQDSTPYHNLHTRYMRVVQTGGIHRGGDLLCRLLVIRPLDARHLSPGRSSYVRLAAVLWAFSTRPSPGRSSYVRLAAVLRVFSTRPSPGRS